MAIVDTPKAPRPSLFAAIQIARVVQQVRRLHKARIKSRAQLHKHQCQAFGNLAPKNLGGLMKLQACRGKLHQQLALHGRRGVARGRDIKRSTLLEHLDCQLTYGARRLSQIALHGHLFLQHNVQSLVEDQSVREVSHVLDLTTLLLDRLYHARKAQRKSGAASDSVKVEKFIANLKHLLRCLQQAALEALMRYSLRLLKRDVRLWHEYWQQRKPKGADWFTEWPSGRRPLSTTWPWNIKPSLLVLWGVCWMFYTSSQECDHPGQARGAWNGQSLSPINAPHFRDGARAQPEFYNPGNIAWRSSQPGHVLGATIPSELNSSPFIGQAVSRTAGASASASSLGRERSQGPDGNSYLPASSSSSVHLNIATATWPVFRVSQDISHNAWEPRQAQSNISPSATQQLSYTNSLLNSYVDPRYQNITLPTDISNLWTCASDFFPQDNLNMPMPDPGNLPSPDHSDRAVSTCSAMPPNLSPSMCQASPPGTDRSPISRRTSSGQHSPPRNKEGQICCIQPECQEPPAVFSRRCEYTKHMDKHTRPYVCGESGCEKIQGFTYSGGLLRHQREVHKQHGGPKAPRMCPHKDCKRSTGSGFSRKENLNEHLRRVHRGVGIDASDAGAEAPAPAAEPPRRQSQETQAHFQRKRRRDVDLDDEVEERVERVEESHQMQVKRMKKELDDRDLRIMMLEGMVQTLTRQTQLTQQRQQMRG